MPHAPRAVVHFEVIGQDPGALRNYYGQLFGWVFETCQPMAVEVSAADEYGFADPGRTLQGAGVPGGVGGGPGYGPRALFYVGVPDVAQALERAETMGGSG